ncbi:hypothetical protein F5890DRAFT_1472385 [Lentinula detonsa]|uniref:CCHC-type domain-containing protein n=1 Tax=Lentinula detonsa TaxID=2804962 RepID=A0AA38Q3Y1_9AGAR|nr:hypothetical protein F5890DRAFT_1472385 [Lentinula detonsa]
MSKRQLRARVQLEATDIPASQSKEVVTDESTSKIPRRVRGTNLVRSNSSPLPELTPEPEGLAEPLPENGMAIILSGGRVEHDPGRIITGYAPRNFAEIENSSEYVENPDKENVAPNLKETVNETGLNDEQNLTIRMAEATLDDAQRDQISRRNQIPIVKDDVESECETPLVGKGKGVDPRNWGALDLSEVEMDENTQHQILDSFLQSKRDPILRNKPNSRQSVELDEHEVLEFLEWRRSKKPYIKGALDTKGHKQKFDDDVIELPTMPSTEARRLRDITSESLSRDYPTSNPKVGGAADRMAESNHKPSQKKEFNANVKQFSPSFKKPLPVSTNNNNEWRNQTGSTRVRDGARKLLSEKEKSEYRAAGKCFECGDISHKARDCPKKTGVKGNAKRPHDPPGLSTYNLEFELGNSSEPDCVHELTVGKLDWYTDVEDTFHSIDNSENDVESEGTLTTDDDPDEGLPPLIECSDESDSDSDNSEYDNEIDTGEMRIDGHEAINSFINHGWYQAIDEIRQSPCFNSVAYSKPPRKRTRTRGRLDPVARQASNLLHRGAPYPGEDQSDPGIMDPQRFLIHRIIMPEGNGSFIIFDSAYEDKEYTLPMSTLEDPDFRIVHWFAKISSGYVAVTLESKWGMHQAMGDVFRKHIMLHLSRIVDLPGDDLPVQIPYGRKTNRFNAYRALDDQFYTIKDNWLGLTFSLPLLLLRDPRVDLKRWIRKQYIRLYHQAFKFPLWEDNIDMFGNLFNHRLDKGPARYMTDEELGQYLQWRTSHMIVRPNNTDLLVGGVQIPKDSYNGLQRNAAATKDPTRKVIRPIIIVTRVNKQPVRALLDSGSLAG